MGHEIVTVNVSQTIGATPSSLQQRSAILSFGSTNLEPGKPVLITQRPEITDFVQNAIGTMTGELASYGTEVKMTLPEGGKIPFEENFEFEITVRGCSPSGWNGTFTAYVWDKNTITWTIPDGCVDGKPDVPGTYSLPFSDDIISATDAFFAQGKSMGVYLLELGFQKYKIADEVAALNSYIQEHFIKFYAYLVPEYWGGDENFISFAKSHASNDAKKYFFIRVITPKNTNYATPYKGIKSIIAIADDTYPKTNAAAAVMWNFVSASPSEVNKVPPMAFRFLQAVNANKAKDNILKTMVAQNINYVDTGAEGGISNTILVKGVTSDGNDMTYWYSVDWVQINVDMALASEVINGSNNPINPLYYNQDGIDRLQQRAQSVFNTGVAYGLVNGQTQVNAIPFKTYVKNNPNDYGIGRYAGLSATYTPMRGFTAVIFNINVTMQLS